MLLMARCRDGGGALAVHLGLPRPFGGSADGATNVEHIVVLWIIDVEFVGVDAHDGASSGKSATDKMLSALLVP